MESSRSDPHDKLRRGVMRLRDVLPPLAPIRTTLIFGHQHRRWEVITQVGPENAEALINLGAEPLEEFPSPTLIAQAMLVL